MPNITIKVNGELQNFQEAEILKLMEVGTGEPVSFTYGSVTSGGNTYEIPFYLNPTEAQAANINNIINTILADESSYNIVVTDGHYRMPAITMLTDRGTSHIVALLIWPDGTANDNFKYEIKRTARGVITTAQNILSFGGGGGVTAETDPTVPAWAKSPTKPSYTKSEVGLGNVDNVKQYSASNPPPYPVASVNGKTGAVSLSANDVKALPDTYTPPDQTAAQVGADPKGTAANAVSAHNTNNAAHNDIRLLIEGLSSRLNALADSTDTDLDQLSEIVAYIKSNKSLIDGITTNKVNVTDIVNNLTTNVTNKPLSAAQGVALKALIDAITVPTKLSQLTGDSTHRVVTDAEKTAWDAKSEFSGKYADLTGKPAIPTVPSNVSAFNNDAGYLKADTISLGIASDGHIYIFVNGSPVGTGIPQGQSGDVFGYVDENNTVVLRGDLADGTYNIKYEMEDGEIVNIGSLVLDTNVYYSITSTLTNCTISNSTKTIAEGESYSATITANSGYELKSVTATMGGTAVTVTNGVINIASVTGNIVIAAVAEEKVVEPTYKNLLPLAVDADGSDYVGDNGEDGYNTGYKLSSSKGTESATSGACVSGYIPITNINDVIRIKNITVSSAASINNITFHKADKSRFYGVAGPAGVLFVSHITADANGVYRFVPSNWLSATTGADLGFFRFSCGDITDETIVTVNEEITD